MARIRTIKPEFWTSEQVVSCSPIARLLFIGLWSFCDDAGIYPASSMSLKMLVFPGDTLSAKETESLINELIQNKLLAKYEVDGKGYWQVTGWHHQKISRPYYKYPPPLHSEDSASKQYISSAHTLLEQGKGAEHTNDIHCTSNHININRDINRDINRKDNSRVADTTRPVTSDRCEIQIDEIFRHWQQVMNHPKAKLDSKRSKIIKQRLQIFSVYQLKQAVDGCASSKFHMGDNPEKRRHDSINLIFRDADHIEKFIDIAVANNSSTGTLPVNIFAGAL